MDLAKIAAHVHHLHDLAEELEVQPKAVTLKMNGKKVKLDADNQCVRLLLGEALAIHKMQAGSGESQFYLVAPRAGACIKADFGERSTEAHVATALLEEAVAKTP